MAKNTKTYAATSKYDGLGIRFYFHASDQADADDKIWSWNRYHGFSDSPGWGWHVAMEVSEAPAECIHDEYIR